MSQPKGQSVSMSYLHLGLTEGTWERGWEWGKHTEISPLYFLFIARCF